jgi:hypothetical protein
MFQSPTLVCAKLGALINPASSAEAKKMRFM